ncbi:peroxisomal carnitine O-octanoyltransferase-like isoform X2 [Dreissena polymorpha]|uniref:peroxisomal carnitine O-octanoyltransferase-like isoform X2 n=1 Tax=Dreissena polymorpha TaxID=45954 RepID=UPI00226410E4|nr:peroxisomal carnitine O-octanoyltransferase-like isoform X2 [Dreissena polymorpha]
MPEFRITESVKKRAFEDIYTVQKELGCGATSKVFKCTHNGTGQPWAVKIIKKKVDRKVERTEIGILLKITHENVIRLKEIYETPSQILLVLDLVTGGELFERIVNKGHYCEKDAAFAVKEMLGGVQYLHENGIIHRDLKPENLLYESSAADAKLKIADFGLSKIIEEQVKANTVCCTPGYCAPEVVTGRLYSTQVDLWSIGVIAYILLCGYEPFNHDSEQQMYKKIVKGDYEFNSTYWDKNTINSKDLISRLLKVNDKERLTAEEALRHPWVRGIAASGEHMEGAQINIKKFNAKRKMKIHSGMDQKNMDVDALFTSDSEKTFQYDSSLPSLPVPSLQHTLDRYLDSVRPHITDSEFMQTEILVQQFASGVGKDLHKQLVKRASINRNWLEQWWLDFTYLDFRLPISPYINFAGPGPYMHHFLPPRPGTQVERAALMSHFSLRFWSHLRKERVKPDKDSRGQHLTMDQFRRLFSTCRIPAVQRDHLATYFKTDSEGKAPSNIVVLCRGRIFNMTVIDDSGEPLTAPELQAQFQRVRDQCDREPEGPGIGALTGDNRTSWAQIRSHLQSLHPDNYNRLEAIQSSIMCVVLDDNSPKDETEVCQLALAGDSRNRWFDKSLSLIYFKNGLTASNCDHTPMDAMVLVVCIYYGDLQIMKCKGKWQGSQEIRSFDYPKELKFIVDDRVTHGISNAIQVYSKIANNLECCTLTFTSYGKTFLRSMQLHPDTHVQLAIQYAFFKRHGRPAATYQTATTRKFYNARTETHRSCTTESVQFARAMLDKSVGVETRAALYLQAAARHNQLMTEATENQGCDRHMFGMQILAMEQGLPMPLIYTDPAYTKSGGGGNFVLSTSFVGYTSVYGGAVPMVEHGYGTFYKIEPTLITTFVSAWKSCTETDAVEFNRIVHECLVEMGAVLKASAGEARA